MYFPLPMSSPNFHLLIIFVILSTLQPTLLLSLVILIAQILTEIFILQLLISLLCDFVFDFGLTQPIETPTRKEPNVLDLILTNSKDRLSNLSISQNLFPLSDHFTVTFLLQLQSHSPKPVYQPKQFLNFSRADCDSMCGFLLDWNFTDCLNSSDVEYIWSQICYLQTCSFMFLCSSLFPSAQMV